MLILLIDDDALYRGRTSALLRGDGHNVLTAEDGTSGLRMVERDPDLVLVDQMMPGISGDEIVGRLRSDHPDLPVVIVSSLDSAEAAVG